jgi:hypothetical protein
LESNLVASTDAWQFQVPLASDLELVPTGALKFRRFQGALNRRQKVRSTLCGKEFS